jgi:hypothetical protein
MEPFSQSTALQTCESDLQVALRGAVSLWASATTSSGSFSLSSDIRGSCHQRSSLEMSNSGSETWKGRELRPALLTSTPACFLLFTPGRFVTRR